MAIRPKTLPAAVAPVAVGTAMAYSDNHFAILPACAALMGSLLLQIGANLANDYFDYQQGIDDPGRIGPVRVTQSGLISPRKVKAGTVITFFLASLFGIYLIAVGGLPIFAVGIASILSAFAYSSGPYPLASHGLGDPFVFIFFGLVAVCGTYYVQALTLTPIVVLASVPTGFLITAILVVNNLRDIQTDTLAGKRTLAVILGVTGSRIEYVLLFANSYLILLSLCLIGQFSLWIFLPLLSLIPAVKTTRIILTESGPVLNEALAATAKIALEFSILLSIGIIL